MSTMKSQSKRLTHRILPAVAAAAVAGIMGTNEAQGQAIFANFGGDGLWSNGANWANTGTPPSGEVAWLVHTPAGPATINTAVPSPTEIVIGQGGGDGYVILAEGGSISSGPVNMAWGSGRNGTWEQTGGTATIGQLRAGRDAGGGLATINISGGSLTTSGDAYLGYSNSQTNMMMTNGTVSITGALRLSDFDNASSALSTANITGGNLSTTGLLAIGVRTGGIGTGRGSFTVGGNAVVNIGTNVAMRPGAGNSFSVHGSSADININRPMAPGITGFEVHQDNDVNFVFDSNGISSVDITALMRWSHADNTLNVDASGYNGTGTFNLFTFAGYFANDNTKFGTENLTFASGYSGSISYNPNSISLTIVPEPASLGLLALAGVFGLRRRRA
jgi:hypothetical protein